MIFIISNVPDEECAQRIAKELVSSRLAACVNILPPIHSVYRWDGKVEEAREITIFIKTRAALYGETEDAIKKLHPYETPEIIAFPIEKGLPAYLEWIGESTTP